MNLLGNAIKFTAKGEVVTRVCAEPLGEGEIMLKVTVSDSGLGISDDKLETIFQAFSQADVSTTRVYGGTGLGLAICTSLVELMGGSIEVESELGQGSSFTFSARCKVLQDQSPRQLPEQMAFLGGTRVLVVDDNSTNREILEAVLRGWNLDPTVVASGSEALEVLRASVEANEPFPLIITDGHMPRMDGFMLAHEISAEAQFAGAVIMMLTSSDLRGDSERARQAGVAAYLTKPVNEDELWNSLLNAMGKRVLAQNDEREAQDTQNPALVGTRILLVEDNPINQEVAAALLEEWGCRVTLAENGQEAVRAHTGDPYELILMDCQMPVMDGFEATQAIREFERGGPRTPIIALTAHAMQGDREKCLDVGMDGHVTKPLDEFELHKVMLAHLPERARVRPDSPALRKCVPRAPQPPLTETLNEGALILRARGKVSTVRKLIRLYRESHPGLMWNIQTSLSQREWTNLAKAAHNLKGAVSNFGATDIVEAALELEILALDGQDLEMARAREIAGTLVSKVIQLDTELTELDARLEDGVSLV